MAKWPTVQKHLSSQLVDQPSKRAVWLGWLGRRLARGPGAAATQLSSWNTNSQFRHRNRRQKSPIFRQWKKIIFVFTAAQKWRFGIQSIEIGVKKFKVMTSSVMMILMKNIASRNGGDNVVLMSMNWRPASSNHDTTAANLMIGRRRQFGWSWFSNHIVITAPMTSFSRSSSSRVKLPEGM